MKNSKVMILSVDSRMSEAVQSTNDSSLDLSIGRGLSRNNKLLICINTYPECYVKRSFFFIVKRGNGR